MIAVTILYYSQYRYHIDKLGEILFHNNFVEIHVKQKHKGIYDNIGKNI